jgi:D-alanyl-D-alanine-carboxypeptidase/D-alanyl-D-alanine-endopeptidase
MKATFSFFLPPIRSLLAGLLLLGHLVAQAQGPVIPQDVIGSILARVTNAYTPGIVVGLIDTNGTAYFSYGVGNLETGRSVNEDSVFEIGSITKTFACTLLSQEILAGGLLLTNSVQSYLPDDIRVPSRNGKVITLQHLATHRSGLPRMPPNWDPANMLNPYVDYVLEAGTDLIHWSPIATNSIWTLPVVDREPAASRFYRLRRQ